MTYENKLPAGFETENVDFDSDKRLRTELYAAAGIAAAAIIALGCLIKNISLLFDASGFFALLGRFILIMLAIAVLLAGQEYLKCFVLGMVTSKPARVVRDRMSARIEYRCWLDKRGYIIMSLAPAAAECLLMIVLMLVLPDKLFWQCYVVFAVILAGAAGDVYIAYRLLREKRDVRVKNEGYKILIATEKKD